jgi:hypothetical protein
MSHTRVIVIVAAVLCIQLGLDAGGIAAPPNKSGNTISPTQNWDTVLPGDQRFTILPGFNNQAVRDNETGLVWERSPSTSQVTWYDAVRTCWHRQVGGRMGWHLPTVEELGSLVDPTIPAPGPGLLAGHPFLSIQPASYWSTTTDVRVEFLPTQAWDVRFDVPGQIGDQGKNTLLHFWCVRGGAHEDKYK